MSGNLSDNDDDEMDQIDLALRLLQSFPREHHQAFDACLLDSLAVTTDIIMDEIIQRQKVVARLSQLVKILQTARDGIYPKDRPAGLRPSVDRKADNDNHFRRA